MAGEPAESADSLVQSAQIVQVNLPSTTNTGGKQWAAILGNGVNSVNGKPVLLVQALEGSRELYKVDACKLNAGDATDTNSSRCDAIPYASSSNSNGLSTPRPVDINGDGTADVVYAGDMQGNMWKFDISASNASGWKVGLGGQPLFTARGLPTKKQADPTQAYRQPITSAPLVVAHPKGGLMVAFGTGRNLTNDDSTDNRDAAKITAEGYRLNTFYGIRDAQKFAIERNGTITLDATTAAGVNSTVQAGSAGTSRFAALHMQSGGELVAESTGGVALRKGASSGSDIGTKIGWYYDLPEINFGNATKVLQNPWLATQGDIVAFFSTNVSNEYVAGGGGGDGSEETCNAGTRYSPSRTQINFFDLFTGQNPNAPTFINADVDAGQTDSGSRYNRYQYDNNSTFLKKEGGAIGPGLSVEVKPPSRPGRFAGWRIIR